MRNTCGRMVFTAHEASVPHVPQVAQSVPSLEGRSRFARIALKIFNWHAGEDTATCAFESL